MRKQQIHMSVSKESFIMYIECIIQLAVYLYAVYPINKKKLTIL